MQNSDALGAADDIVRGHRSAKKLIGAWRPRNGEIRDVALAMMCDGVMHAALERASWFDEFEQAAEAATLEIDLAKGEAERREEAEQREKNSGYAKKNHGRPSILVGKAKCCETCTIGAEPVSKSSMME